MSIRNVSKKFGNVEVLRQIDLDVSPGEFIVIVGKSGCGKSTLLRLIAGLEQASDGQLLFDEQQLVGLHPDTRIMFQDSRLLPWKSALDNVKIGALNNKKEVAKTALQQVGLADKERFWPGVLSGGQQQRVSLARALAGEPRLLLFDEPLGALDALTRLEMQNLIEQIWTEDKFTAILVTHDVSEAIRLADRVIIIQEGKIDLDLKIPLARPRVVNAEFANYQNIVLQKLMTEV